MEHGRAGRDSAERNELRRLPHRSSRGRGPAGSEAGTAARSGGSKSNASMVAGFSGGSADGKTRHAHAGCAARAAGRGKGCDRRCAHALSALPPAGKAVASCRCEPRCDPGRQRALPCSGLRAVPRAFRAPDRKSAGRCGHRGIRNGCNKTRCPWAISRKNLRCPISPVFCASRCIRAHRAGCRR